MWTFLKTMTAKCLGKYKICTLGRRKSKLPFTSNLTVQKVQHKHFVQYQTPQNTVHQLFRHINNHFSINHAQKKKSRKLQWMVVTWEYGNYFLASVHGREFFSIYRFLIQNFRISLEVQYEVNGQFNLGDMKITRTH